VDLAKIRKKASVSRKSRKPARDEEPVVPESEAAGAAEPVPLPVSTEEPRPAPRSVPRASKAPSPLYPDEGPVPVEPASEPDAEVDALAEEFAPAASRRKKDRAVEEILPEIGSDREVSAGRDEKMIICLVGRERYAIPIMDVSMIIDNKVPTRIPRVPEFLVGIIALRGKIVTVLDARSRLGIKGSSSLGDAKIIIVERGSDSFGIRVEGIEHVVEVDRAAFEEPPEGVARFAQDFVDGVFYHRKRAVASLNIDLFLTFEV